MNEPPSTIVPAPIGRRTACRIFVQAIAAAHLGLPNAGSARPFPMRSTRRHLGAAVTLRQLRYDADFRRLILAHCHSLTPELAMKWAAVQPTRDALRLSEMDALSQFARNHRLRLRGHALLWHRSIPDWLTDVISRDRDWSVVDDYFATVMPRYHETIATWDVVNEPIDTGKRHDGLRQSLFLDAFGPTYIRQALESARRHAPRAKLALNDYGFDYDIPVEKDRRWLFLRLIERLKRDGVPLDCVGIQGHLDLSKGPFNPIVFADFLKELADFGLDIEITELDVKERDLPQPADRRDAAVADIVRRYLDVAMNEPAVTGVTCWGFSDRYSWLEVTSADLDRHPGAWREGDGPGVNRGLPFDSSLRPKPMFEVVKRALQSPRPRRAA